MRKELLFVRHAVECSQFIFSRKDNEEYDLIIL